MQYPTAWPTVAKEVLVVQGKQTILLTTLINRKQEMKIFQLTLVKPLSTAVTLTSWNWCRTIAIETENWRLWLNGWVIRTVKTLGCQKTICPLPALVQEYLQQSPLEKPASNNAVPMTKILTKEPSVTWRCYIPRSFVMSLYIVALTYKDTTWLGTSSQFRTLYDCSQPQHLGIFGFPSLENCSHIMLQQEATVSTFRGKVLRYSPVLPPSQSTIAR